MTEMAIYVAGYQRLSFVQKDIRIMVLWQLQRLPIHLLAVQANR